MSAHLTVSIPAPLARAWDLCRRVNLDNPSVTALPCHLPLGKGGEKEGAESVAYPLEKGEKKGKV